MTRGLALALALVIGLPVAADAKPRRKKPRFSKRIEHPPAPTETPAFRYGQMGAEACEAELTARGIPFETETARGVYAPVRLTGPLHGVTFRTELPAAQRATTVWEIADCRLVLALDDFAQLLEAHDIVEVHHYSMYRPPSKSWPEDKIGTRHNGAVAIDAGRFVDKDGHVLDVDKHFSGSIDAKTCGPGARPRKVTPDSTRLRALLCETVDAHVFNIVLTPNFNKPHHNHFHMEITGAMWFLVH